MSTAKDLATQFAAAFETATRTDGSTYVRLAETAPEWCMGVVRAAHDNCRMLPDDTRYAMIREIADELDESEDWDDLELDHLVDISYYDLGTWLGSHSERFGYCDEALSEFGAPDDTANLLQRGQLLEYQEIAAAVVQALQEKAAEMDNAEGGTP